MDETPPGASRSTGAGSAVADRATALLGLPAALVVTALVAAVGGGLVLLPEVAASRLDDLSQLLAAAVATLACALAARREGRGAALPWVLLALACAAWTLAQLWWTVSVHLRGVEVPFPSPSDVGFSAFIVLASLGLGAWNARRRRHTRAVRDLLDGLIIGGSFLALAWVTTLEQVWSSADVVGLEQALSVLYPVGDIALATVAILAASRAPEHGRLPLVLVSSGLIALAAADTAFLYATGSDTYGSGNLLGLGWVLGFLLITLGAIAPPVRDDGRPVRPLLGLRGVQALPYIPLTVCIGAVALVVHERDSLSERTLWAVLALFVLVLVRQFLVLLDNRTLLRALRTDAHVDALTGLANRRVVEARLVHAITQGTDTDLFREVAVLMCDVNGLKRANDQFGHDAGDEVLRQVGVLLTDAVAAVVGDDGRDTVVGRIGGDEFAVVLTGEATTRLDALRESADLRSVSLPYGAGLSCGSGRLTAPPPNVTTAQEMMRTLLRLADGELYARKRGTSAPPVVGTVQPGVDALAMAEVVHRVHQDLSLQPDAPTSARLAVAAGGFARAVGAAAWWVSAVTEAGTLDDVLSEQVRPPADPVAPTHLSDLPVTSHELSAYPLSDATARGAVAGFHVTQLSGPDEERTYLAATGYAQVLGSGGHGWLVEVFGDAATDDLGVHLPLLRSLVTVALGAPPVALPHDHAAGTALT
ncbi:GGDEF domain-containing protein [Solicola sp. PLA-1-18]|uniref:GGDEF domain-containing protein n=1 Tax=Solicola sp. PLA-1-18 TaxID=3380532 RepID=UPI003B7B54AB